MDEKKMRKWSEIRKSIAEAERQGLYELSEHATCDLDIWDREFVCSICGKPLVSDKHNPFCSERCRMVDLYNWLNDEYSLPVAEHKEWSGEDV